MAPSCRTIAVIGGTGSEGSGLALRWALAGHRIIIGSRSEEKARRAAEELMEKAPGSDITGLSNAGAAEAAEIVVLSVPYAAHDAIARDVKKGCRGKVVIDVAVPINPDNVRVVMIPPGGSASQEAQAILGEEARVVSAFQNVSAHKLADPEKAVECDVLVCGDDKEAKAVAIELAEAAGMRGLDVGPLANAVVVEGLTPILIGLNIRYKVKGSGIKITGIR